ncbi:N2227-like protein-domain-containing protein [Myxozyma melibiosi]|uniref:carnosine N-methyltransferase n=1 Tax=Myxozyma melibiosi TaxID=54550 RepID=A0ABR1EYL2_9ASCO
MNRLAADTLLKKTLLRSSIVLVVYSAIAHNAPPQYSKWFALLVFFAAMLALLRSLLRFQLARLTPPPESNDRLALIDTVAGLLAYPGEMHRFYARRRLLFSRMSARHQHLVSGTGYAKRLAELGRLADRNGELATRIAKLAEKQYNITRGELLYSRHPVANARVVELLKHFVRDWSDEGKRERDVLFPPIIDAIKQEFGVRSNKRVLVPGAGVGRLAYEISLLGCETEANEFSQLMHLGNLFALEQIAESCTVYPFIHNLSHQTTGTQQFRAVRFPDTTPADKDHSGLEVRYGDFLQLKTRYDAIATLFFIDTAENVLDYIDTIKRLLVPGGIWVNYGPLKWGTAPKAEMTAEEMELLLPKMGFTIEKRWSGQAEYVADSESMWRGFYGLEGWIARKS